MENAMLKEFRSFVLRGNVFDLAVGIILGTAIGQIVNSLVKDILMPPIGLVLSKVDFSGLYLNLSGMPYDSFQAAQQAGAPTINYGLFINTILNFLIISLVIFMLVRQANRLKGAPQPQAASTTRPCPYCRETIAIEASRCPHCTSQLKS
jgi:large conductance mechanosensitive channel